MFKPMLGKEVSFVISPIHGFGQTCFSFFVKLRGKKIISSNIFSVGRNIFFSLALSVWDFNGFVFSFQF